jgi:hypothetical protein
MAKQNQFIKLENTKQTEKYSITILFYTVPFISVVMVLFLLLS